jgi:outer membrane protein assembly factor BamB
VDRGRVLMHGQWSNPVYTEAAGKAQVIFPGGDGWLYAFEPRTGEVLWKFDANPKSSFYALGGRGTRNDFISTPVVHEDRLYIGVGQDPEHDMGLGHFWCIDLVQAIRTGGDVSPELVASDDGKGQMGKPNPNSAAAWHFGGLVEPPPKRGRKWHFSRTLSTAAVHDGLCVIADQEGFVYCLDAKTGKKYWDHDMEAATWSSPYSVDGKIYMGNDKEQVLIFKHGKEKELLAEIDMGGYVRATPAAVNGVLYVMTEHTLYAIK